MFPLLLLIFGAIWCTKASESAPRAFRPSGATLVLGMALLLYAVLTFVYFYRTTGGAFNVEAVTGHFFAGSKNADRPITEYEYRISPNLWTRAMTAWSGTIAVMGLIDSPAASRRE
jgi:hypothetical protein